MFALEAAVFAIVIPVCSRCVGSDSANTWNPGATPVVAIPVSLTVIPLLTKLNTDDATGNPLPWAAVISMLPVRSETELPLVIFTDDREAIVYVYVASMFTVPLSGWSVGFTSKT